MRKIKDDVCKKLGINTANCFPIGFFGDGVPHTKHKTIEVMSWNILSIPDSERFPFVVIEKQFCCKCGCGGRHTLEPFLQVFCWSMRALIEGVWPKHRHDREPWSKTDAWRQKQDGPLPAHAVVAQIRGDWAYYKQLFGFPAWSNRCICWLCPANKDEASHPFWNFKAHASWRHHRYTIAEFWRLMHLMGVAKSCIFELPGVTLAMVTIDPLHAMDLGFSQDLLGNVLWEFQKCGLCPGSNVKDRVAALWLKLKAHYIALGTPNRIQALTVEMLKMDKKGPKLRTKGAETRSLVPFGLVCAKEMYEHDPSPHNEAVFHCMSALMDLYLLLSLPVWNPSAASTACRRCLVHYQALSEEMRKADRPLFWRIKPKAHMFCELGEYMHEHMGNPSLFWNYKDEDFVGYISRIAHPRGGPRQASSTGKAVLERYSALKSL